MKPFPIPVVAVGPGTQPPDDENLSYLELPQGMDTFAMPSLPEPAAARGLDEAQAALRWLHDAAEDYADGGPPQRLDVSALDLPNRQLLDQILGEGEVSATIAGEAPIAIQESVFAGIWRVRLCNSAGAVVRDLLEAGAIPECVIEAAHGAASPFLPDIEPPAGLMSALPVIAEVGDRVATRRPEEPPLVINLTLLPLSPADGAHLARVFAPGPVTILSRGYGNCRITGTVVRDTWWVQYFNNMDRTLLDSLEIARIPEVAMAAREDVGDSALRLGEVIDWIERG